jgi:hypothetical protein
LRVICVLEALDPHPNLPPFRRKESVPSPGQVEG